MRENKTAGEIRTTYLHQINMANVSEDVKTRTRDFITSSYSISAMVSKIRIRSGQIELELNTLKPAEVVIGEKEILHLINQAFEINDRYEDIPLLILKYG